MPKKPSKKPVIENILYWAPRILTFVPFLLFLIFSLDSFNDLSPFYMQLLGFLMHMIPGLILVAILIIAWKWETIGGISLVILSIISVFFFNFELMVIFIISLPLLLVGVMFLVHEQIYRK